MLRMLLDFWNDERGQALVEYALIVAVVSIVSLAGLKFLGQQANNALRTVGGGGSGGDDSGSRLCGSCGTRSSRLNLGP